MPAVTRLSAHLRRPPNYRYQQSIGCCALLAKGYVRQLPNKRYALGPRLIRLGYGASKQLGGLGLPQLTSLVERLKETSNMAVLDSNMVLYVAQVPSKHSMRMFTEVRRRAQAHATGVRKAILAQLDDSTVRTIVISAEMSMLTELGIGTMDGLLRNLGKVRQSGYSIDDGEQEVGVRCFAMAAPSAPTPTAISVSGPLARVDESFAERAVPLLQEAVQSISDDVNRAGRQPEQIFRIWRNSGFEA